MLASSAVPALLTIPLRWSVPESPLWLVAMGRLREAQRIVDDQLGRGYRLHAQDGSRPSTRSAWYDVFSAQHRGMTALASTLFFCLVVPYFAVSTFIPQVMTFVMGSFAITSVTLLLCATSGLPAFGVIVSFAVFACVLSAAQTQIYAYLPELFPTSVRAGDSPGSTRRYRLRPPETHVQPLHRCGRYMRSDTAI